MLIKNPHEMDVYVKCKEVLTIAYENGYYLSFTGYNLGAFMAQLCLTYCHKQASTDTFLSKAVLFDPIGVAKGIRQLTKRTDNDDFDFNETVGATVTYLSFPTVLNCCTQHVAGSIYQIYPQLPTLDSLDNWFCHQENLSEWVKYGLFSLSEISLKNILQTFDMSTNKPKHYSVVKEWPYMKKESWNDKDDEIVFRILNLLSKYKITPSDDVDSLQYREIDHDTSHEMIPGLNNKEIKYKDDDSQTRCIHFRGSCVVKAEDPLKSHMKKTADAI